MHVHTIHPKATASSRAAGARAMRPWLVGIVPYGLVIGTTAAHSRVPAVVVWLTGPLIFTGSAQVAVIHLLDVGTAPFVVVLTALAMNLRLVLYSATMAPLWQDTRRRWRALAAYLLVDPSVAVGLDGYRRAEDRGDAHDVYLGGAALLWFAWVGAIGVGALVGSRLPGGLHLELVIPIFLVGEVAGRVKDRSSLAAAVASVAVALVAIHAPFQLGLLAAITIGITVGVADRDHGGDR